MQLERAPGESEYQFHKRLVYGKLVDRTLADLDYSEIADKVYGKPYASDVARRMMYGSKYTIDLLDRDGIRSVSGNDILSELDRKKIEVQKERQKLFDQRREYKKLISAEGRTDHLRSIVESAASKLNEDIGVIYEAPDDVDFDDNDAIVVFGDWHYGMTTSNIFNSYNTEICRERVKSTVLKMIQRIKLHHCETAHIVILGDMFHGAVHVSARVASEEVVCEQIMHVSEILAQSICEISRYVKNVRVYLTYGNHARTVQNKKDSVHSDNMERIVGWWLAERFKDNERITVVDGSADYEFITLDVRGHTFLASHGDLDNVGAAPQMLSTLFHKARGMDIEYILLGDKHHRDSFSELGITSMLCGSLCGTDDYANDKRLYSEPHQLLLIVNESCGVDAEYRIKA